MKRKTIFSVAICSMLALTTVGAAQANDAYKQLNQMAINMWLQQKANQGIVFPDPVSANNALQYEQMGGRIASPYYSPFNYGPVYSPYYWPY